MLDTGISCVLLSPEYIIYGVFLLADLIDKKYMRLALELAEKGRGSTRPNPLVGAIIVKNGKIVGKGFHKVAGQPHAEIKALKQAGAKAKNASLYLNLEPCCHTGQTGPCTTKIIEAGIKRVVFAVKDPDPRVNGKGARILKQAGIEVKSNVLKKETLLQNDIFFGYLKNQKPYVILKIAQTLDGKIATSSGDSKWITSKKSREYAHRLRSEVDAVIVGGNTVRTDNPQLTVRNVKGKNPYRIIVSNSLKFPSNSHLITNNKDIQTIIATSNKKIPISLSQKKSNLIWWQINKNSSGGLDFKDLIQKANDFGIKSILVEGGAQITTAFLKKELFDKLIVITAPKIIGAGVDSINDIGILKISKAMEFDSYTTSLGVDNLFVGYPRKDKKE